MNIQKAQDIAVITSHLAVAVSQYQATFGKEYRLVSHSPLEAIDLSKKIADYQAGIARLLDYSSLLAVQNQAVYWWERMDVMDNATVSGLVKHVYQLISSCGHSDNTYNLGVIQSVIAGILHPEIRYQVIPEIEAMTG